MSVGVLGGSLQLPPAFATRKRHIGRAVVDLNRVLGQELALAQPLRFVTMSILIMQQNESQLAGTG
jgi:hypothetical protein